MVERAADYRTRYRHFGTEHPDPVRQAFHHTRTSLGALHTPSARGVAGHWIHLVGAAAPFAITELVKDTEQQSRALRALAVTIPLLSEAVWTYHLSQERNRDANTRRALKACEDHSH